MSKFCCSLILSDEKRSIMCSVSAFNMYVGAVGIKYGSNPVLAAESFAHSIIHLNAIRLSQW